MLDKTKLLLEKISSQNEENAFVSTLGLEKEVNTFFRLHNPQVNNRLKIKFPELTDSPTPKEIFFKLMKFLNRNF